MFWFGVFEFVCIKDWIVGEDWLLFSVMVDKFG